MCRKYHLAVFLVARKQLAVSKVQSMNDNEPETHA